jgi:radical SAM protein (TIGR04043 family)
MSNPANTPSAPLVEKQALATELQSRGLNLQNLDGRTTSRRGGAGPSDHVAVTIDERTFMIPVHTNGAINSEFSAEPINGNGDSKLRRNGKEIGSLSLPTRPRFYDLETAAGIPYWKIATLHARNVLATTVLQSCIRYPDRRTRCQFCAIGQSLIEKRTIAIKTPEMLAEVTEAAHRLDNIEQLVMTTGTPKTKDRGAAVLAECAVAVTARLPLPIQAQLEPPDDFTWFRRLRDSGVNGLGMHLEAWDPDVRARIMPGKAEIPVSYYLQAYAAAVEVFGRGQVSTYLLAGLGDSRETLIDAARQLIEIGVYPFIAPFVPITGTQLEEHPAPSSDFMISVLQPVGQMLKAAGMTSDKIKSGCSKCGACSTLSEFER